MLRSVLIIARPPPPGTIAPSEAERSNPAERGEPRAGMIARSLRNFTRSGSMMRHRPSSSSSSSSSAVEEEEGMGWW